MYGATQMAKAKSVSLRKNPPKANGTQSFYLEYYGGYTKKENGNTEPIRKREMITGLFLYAKPKNAIERKHNKESEATAKAIQSKKSMEIANNTFGYDTDYSNADFTLYLKDMVNDLIEQKHSTANQFRPLLGHYLNFIGSRKISFSDVDVDFCNKFKYYLTSQVNSRRGGQLSSTMIKSYLVAFKQCLKRAVNDDIITKNPMDKIKLPKNAEKKIVYLTEADIKTLVESECKNPVVKRAFLFSCYTGLRHSDIISLKWGDIKTEAGITKVVKNQQKTKGLIGIKLKQAAIDLMGTQGKPNELVFLGLPVTPNITVPLKRWIKTTTIKKDITFHVARHTFATLLISKDISIFTVQKALGHKNINTTMKYAHQLDSVIDDAIDLLPEF